MNDFKLCNIIDSQLEDITSELTIPVITGSTSSTFQTFNAQGGIGNSQIQFNVQIPSLDTAVNRHFLVQTTIDLKIDFAGGVTADYWAPNAVLFKYGNTNSLQAFPLNALLATIQSGINNQNVSVNTRDVMAGLLKMYNYTELARYNSMTPSLIDSFYHDYQDGIGSNNNVLSNYSVGGFTKEYQPRGCFPVQLFGIDPNGALIPLNSLKVVAGNTGTAPYASIMLRFTTTEPLLFLSPYISGSSNNQASFLGLNNLTITMNIGDATRVMSNASYAVLHAGGDPVQTITNVTLSKYTSPKLMLNFLTIPPFLASKIEPKNIVNYNTYNTFNYNAGTVIPAFGSNEITFSNCQLNQVPNKILIFAKKQQMTTYDSNSFMAIEKISLTFANRSGLLSSATQVQLYEMSVKNGLQMNFYEFSGEGISNDTNGDPMTVPTTGSILVIDPAINLSIDPQYSNMSQGQFGLQFSVTLHNQTSVDIIPTLYVVVVNSGIFITERGTCDIRTGVLSQEMVLDTKSKDAVMDKQTYEDHIVGGSIENLGCIHKHMKLSYHKAAQNEHQLDSAPGESVPRITASGMDAAGIPAMAKRRIHKYTQ